MYAYLLVFALLNMYAFWLIPWIELMNGILHIALWLILAVVLGVLAPKHSSTFVLTEKANLSGWDDDFVSFNLGIQLVRVLVTRVVEATETNRFNGQMQADFLTASRSPGASLVGEKITRL